MPLDLDEHMKKKQQKEQQAKATANHLMLEVAMKVYASILGQYDMGVINNELCTKAATVAIRSAPAFALAAGVVKLSGSDSEVREGDNGDGVSEDSG